MSVVWICRFQHQFLQCRTGILGTADGFYHLFAARLHVGYGTAIPTLQHCQLGLVRAEFLADVNSHFFRAGLFLLAEDIRGGVTVIRENMQEDILVKCLDLKKEINEALFQYLIQKDDVINQIQKLNDYRYLVILYEHYIPDKKGHVKTLHEIAVEHDWCDEHTYYLHWQAVKALNDVLPPSILAAEGVSAF